MYLLFKCVLVEQDWDGMIPALLAKKFDTIIASMSITEERKKRVDFSDKYYDTPARFVGKNGSGLKIDKSALAGKRSAARLEPLPQTTSAASSPSDDDSGALRQTAS